MVQKRKTYIHVDTRLSFSDENSDNLSAQEKKISLGEEVKDDTVTKLTTENVSVGTPTFRSRKASVIESKKRKSKRDEFGPFSSFRHHKCGQIASQQPLGKIKVEVVEEESEEPSDNLKTNCVSCLTDLNQAFGLIWLGIIGINWLQDISSG